jgi:Fe-S-cluster-containing hydrogenase component 2
MCDLCEDEEDGPQCVKWCPKDALEVTIPDRRAQRTRRKRAIEEVLGQ